MTYEYCTVYCVSRVLCTELDLSAVSGLSSRAVYDVASRGVPVCCDCSRIYKVKEPKGTPQVLSNTHPIGHRIRPDTLWYHVCGIVDPVSRQSSGAFPGNYPFVAARRASGSAG